MGTIPLILGLPLSRKRLGAVSQAFLTTHSSPGVYTLTPILAVPGAMSLSVSVSPIIRCRVMPMLRRELKEFLNDQKTGFAQADFKVICNTCRAAMGKKLKHTERMRDMLETGKFTREELGVAKFTRDAVLNPEDVMNTKDHGNIVYLP